VKRHFVSIALIPGSFDPVTNGHLDIVGRTARTFDQVLVAVASNPRKASTLFSVEERVTMLTEVLGEWPNVVVRSFSGLLADFAVAHGVTAIVKGVRAVSDFDYELQMAQMNLRLSGVDTIFMPTAVEHSFLSATLVREVASYGGDVSSMVPASVVQRLKERFAL
jgi:pantetheine-phosphate adenylyltransferase